MFLSPILPHRTFYPSGLCALRPASNLTLSSLMPHLAGQPEHAIFTVENLLTQDGVPLQVRACVCWQDAPERNVLVGPVDSKMLVTRFTKMQLGEWVAQTWFADLLLNRSTMDAPLRESLQRCVTDLPVTLDTVHVLGFGVSPVLEANHNTRALATMRALLVRSHTSPSQHVAPPPANRAL